MRIAIERERLPNRRAAHSFDFAYSGQSWVVHVSHYPDGRLAEVFASGSKPTSEVASMARDAAVLISIALQHGVALDIMRAAVTRLQDDAPATVAGRILDALHDHTEGVEP
jgi:hypothetical protein